LGTQLARDACAKRGSHMGVDARANRCSQTEVPVVMHALASLLTEPRDHTAQSYMPIWCVIGRFCHIVTVCQVARYRSFLAV